MTHCVEAILLRLQSMWITKLITSGLLIPAGNILTGRGTYDDSGKVISKLTILLAYAIIASGQLPIVIVFIPLAVLGECLMALVSWSTGKLKINSDNDIAALSTSIAQALAATVQLVLQKMTCVRPQMSKSPAISHLTSE